MLKIHPWAAPQSPASFAPCVAKLAQQSPHLFRPGSTPDSLSGRFDGRWPNQLGEYSRRISKVYELAHYFVLDSPCWEPLKLELRTCSERGACGIRRKIVRVEELL